MQTEEDRFFVIEERWIVTGEAPMDWKMRIPSGLYLEEIEAKARIAYLKVLRPQIECRLVECVRWRVIDV